ncbi:MAG: tRNA (adenosine(37)-N6)-dimethylallyltransferase MiaA [Sphingomonadales bacterium]|nr:tRNA (adenosine(37)-N6)-dimethylallyltransferase MiaA [Sphingomonadales bacterium]
MSTDNSPESRDPVARPPVALIAGPTASGKSDCAVRLAQAIVAAGREAVVINADSAQVYADLRVLSARPSDAEMAGVPHRLFGAWDGASACSAADWALAAAKLVAETHAQGGVPILVGGTGLYLRTLLDGIAPVPAIDAAVRARVRGMAVADAHAALVVADPDRAAALAPADAARVQRALEVAWSTGRTLGAWQARREGGIGDAVDLNSLVLLPERGWLYERCDRRFSTMLEHGAIDEVAALLARGLDANLPVMRAIGVPQIAGFLRGEWGRDEALRQGAQATRNYAKRQYTWFRHQPPAGWGRLEERYFDPEVHFATLLRDLRLT